MNVVSQHIVVKSVRRVSRLYVSIIASFGNSENYAFYGKDVFGASLNLVLAVQHFSMFITNVNTSPQTIAPSPHRDLPTN